MEITTFKEDYLPEMAALFISNFKSLRLCPVLPDLMENTDQVVRKLADLFNASSGVLALDRGKVVGYLGWFLVEHFRGTDRKGAYCPEWGHATTNISRQTIYQALYRAAAAQWVDAGCQVHALTLFANEQDTEKVWFWNGFGLTVVDAIRPLTPLEIVLPTDLTIRAASPEDVEALRTLELEHWQHYVQPPILMDAYSPWETPAIARFLDDPKNSIWLAMDSETCMGYMRFEPNSEGAAAIVDGPDKIAITAAFVRPAFRGRKAAAAMLESGIRHYTAQGLTRCSVDFESFNPEAASFWLKYFEPVCFSVLRVPERAQNKAAS